MPVSTHVLEPGDRFPNVLVRDEQGTQSLYNRHQGDPVVIVWGENTPAAVREALRACAGRVECIDLDTASAGSACLEVDGELHAAIVANQSRGVLLLDRALRTWARIDEGAVEEIAQRVAGLLSGESAPSRQGLIGSAPVLVLPRVLEPALCEEVLAYFWQSGGGEPSGVIRYDRGQPTFQLDPDVKMRRELVIASPELEARVHDRIGRRAVPEIERAFAFRVSRREHFKIIAYAAGAGYFRAHRDNDTRDVAHRRFALTLNLNTGEYRGGGLRFPEFGDHLYEPGPGGALVFSCSLLHEVTDITDGTRVAMTSFFS